MTRTITKAVELPAVGSEEHRALEILLGTEVGDASTRGFLVGYAAGKAAAQLPKGSRILRVVVVAEVGTDS